MISQANANGCRLKIACADLDLDHKTFCRWRINSQDQRQGPISAPKNKLTRSEQNEIIKTATSREFQDESPWVIVAKLADRGQYIASESSFYKYLKQHKLLTHRGKSKCAERKKPLPLIASGPNQIWSWDISYLKTSIRGQYFYLYLFLDIFSRKIIGFDIHDRESMELSSELIKKLCSNEGIEKNQICLHADNGGPMKGATMLATLEKLGVAASFSRPRVSNDNPFSESLFKTLKYCPKYPDRFDSIEEAKRWVIKFLNWYNEEHLHSGIKYVTPNQRHQGLDKEILESRHQVYLEARSKHPERWGNKSTRNWERDNLVYLNNLQKKIEIGINSAS